MAASATSCRTLLCFCVTQHGSRLICHRSLGGPDFLSGPLFFFLLPAQVVVTDPDIAPPIIEIVMIHFLENLIAGIWNRLKKRGEGVREERGSLEFGFRVADGQVTKRRFELSNGRRTMHIAILGKTGSGKSFAMRHAAAQDIEAG